MQKTPVLFAQLGQYTMQVQLASLGVCELWRVESAPSGNLTRPALLYRLRPEFAADRRIVEDFIGAGQLAKRLRHPNIVATEDIVEDGAEFGIVCEYVLGTTVHELVCQVRACKNSLPPWFALEVARLICVALRHAHSLRDAYGRPAPILHRAIDSSAIIIAGSGQVKLSGFGIGEFLLRRQAPPTSEPRAQDQRSDDVARVAMILCELMRLSVTPLGVDQTPELTGPIPQRQQLIPHVPRQLENLLRRALEPGRSDGFIQIDQFADCLESYIIERRQRVKPEHLAAFVKVIALSDGQSRSEQREPFGASAPQESSLATAGSLAADPSADEETGRQPPVETSVSFEPNLVRQTMPTQPNLDALDELDWAASDIDAICAEEVGVAIGEFASGNDGDADGVAEVDPSEDSIVFDAPEVLNRDDEPNGAAAIDEWQVSAEVDFEHGTPVLDTSERGGPSSHNWLAAIESARAPSTESVKSTHPPPAASVAASPSSERQSALAISAFEEGFERLRAGDLLGAELIWKRALEYDPEFRAAATNLKRIQKRRSEPPK